MALDWLLTVYIGATATQINSFNVTIDLNVRCCTIFHKYVNIAISHDYCPLFRVADERNKVGNYVDDAHELLYVSWLVISGCNEVLSY